MIKLTLTRAYNRAAFSILSGEMAEPLTPHHSQQAIDAELATREQFYREQGEDLATVLWEALPSGTLRHCIDKLRQLGLPEVQHVQHVDKKA